MRGEGLCVSFTLPDEREWVHHVLLGGSIGEEKESASALRCTCWTETRESPYVDLLRRHCLEEGAVLLRLAEIRWENHDGFWAEMSEGEGGYRRALHWWRWDKQESKAYEFSFLSKWSAWEEVREIREKVFSSMSTSSKTWPEDQSTSKSPFEEGNVLFDVFVSARDVEEDEGGGEFGGLDALFECFPGLEEDREDWIEIAKESKRLVYAHKQQGRTSGIPDKMASDTEQGDIDLEVVKQKQRDALQTEGVVFALRANPQEAESEESWWLRGLGVGIQRVPKGWERIEPNRLRWCGVPEGVIITISKLTTSSPFDWFSTTMREEIEEAGEDLLDVFDWQRSDDTLVRIFYSQHQETKRLRMTALCETYPALVFSLVWPSDEEKEEDWIKDFLEDVVSTAFVLQAKDCTSKIEFPWLGYELGEGWQPFQEDTWIHKESRTLVRCKKLTKDESKTLSNLSDFKKKDNSLFEEVSRPTLQGDTLEYEAKIEEEGWMRLYRWKIPTAQDKEKVAGKENEDWAELAMFYVDSKKNEASITGPFEPNDLWRELIEHARRGAGGEKQ